MVRLEELEWSAENPALNLAEHLWNELESRLHPRTPHPPSVPDLTEAPVAEWAEIPTTTDQNVVKKLPRGVEAVTAANKGKFCNGFFDTYIWI